MFLDKVLNTFVATHFLLSSPGYLFKLPVYETDFDEFNLTNKDVKNVYEIYAM